jgi:hypothetical protein
MFSLPRSGLFLALLALSAPTILAQSAVPNQKSPLTGTAAISGHLALSGKSAIGVTVALFPNDSRTIGGSYQGKFIAKTVTDDQGNYKIEGLSAGGYKVLPVSSSFVLPGQDNGPFGPGKYVSVAGGESVGSIDFELVQAGVVSGRVTLATGQPAARVSVSISHRDQHAFLYDPATGGLRQPEMTDDNGVFRIYGLAPDQYKLIVYSYGAHSQSPTEVYYPGVTDESRATLISVAPGQEVAAANVTIGVPDRTYEAAGQILDDAGKPIANATYVLYPVSDSGAPLSGLNNTPTLHAEASGQFRVQGLSAGKHAIAVVPDEQLNVCSDPAVINIEGADVSGVRLQVHSGAVASGVVVIEGSEDPRILAQLSKLRLNVMSIEKAPHFSVRVLDLPADGSFKAVGFGAGRLSFSLNPGSGVKDFSIVRIERDGTPQKGNLLSISDGEQLTGVRVVLAYGAGVITGQVSIQGGALPDGTQVLVSAQLISDKFSVFGRTGLVDVRGRFEIGSLLDGQYDITTSYISGGKRIGGPQHQTVSVAGGQAPDTTVVLDLSEK